MKLVNPTDDQLNAAFAQHVAGWFPIEPKHSKGSLMMVDEWWDAKGYPVGAPRFVTSVDAVTPWLEKAGRWSAIRGADGLYEINLDDIPMPETGVYWAIDASLPRAAVIALLRAHGVEVEFDPAKMAGY